MAMLVSPPPPLPLFPFTNQVKHPQASAAITWNSLAISKQMGTLLIFFVDGPVVLLGLDNII